MQQADTETIILIRGSYKNTIKQIAHKIKEYNKLIIIMI